MDIKHDWIRVTVQGKASPCVYVDTGQVRKIKRTGQLNHVLINVDGKELLKPFSKKELEERRGGIMTISEAIALTESQEIGPEELEAAAELYDKLAEELEIKIINLNRHIDEANKHIDEYIEECEKG